MFLKTNLNGVIAAIADEHLEGAWWVVLHTDMLMCPFLQAGKALHTLRRNSR